MIEKAKVYFTKEITPESLFRIYNAMGITLGGRVAVKISTGELCGHNFLNPHMIKDPVQERGLPRARIALAWLLSKPYITAPIVGSTKGNSH